MVVIGGYAYVGTRDAIMKVDTTTGASTLLAGSPTDPPTSCNQVPDIVCGVGDMVTDGTSLYAVVGPSARQVARVLPTTGAASIVVDAAGQIGGLTVTSAGMLYVTVGTEVRRIDPSNGTSTVVASLAGALYGIATDDTALYVSHHYQDAAGANHAEIDKIALATSAVSVLVVDLQLGLSSLEYAGGYVYASAEGGVLQRDTLVRRYSTSDGSRTTVAGAADGYRDGTGADAWLNGVTDLSHDGSYLYVTDSMNNRVRRIEATSPLPAGQPGWVNGTALIDSSELSLVAGSGSALTSAGTSQTAGFNTPSGIVVSGGYAYVGTSDAISKVNLSTGATTILSGGVQHTPGWSCSEQDGSPGSAADVCVVQDMVSDGHFLYTVTDAFPDAIARISMADGSQSQVWVRGTNPVTRLDHLTVGPTGQLYVTFNNEVDQVDPLTGAATPVHIYPAGDVVTGLAADGESLFVNHAIVDGTGSVVTYSIEKMTLVGQNVTVVYQNRWLDNVALESAGDYLYTGLRYADPPELANTDMLIRISKSSGAAVSVASGYQGRDVTPGTVICDVAGDGTSLYIADCGHNVVARLLPIPTPGANGGPTAPQEVVGGCQCAHAQPAPHPAVADPVDPATGALSETATDLAVPGRGMQLSLGRTYDSQLAGSAGRFGPGWTDTYAMSITVDPGSTGVLDGAAVLDVRQESGSLIQFIRQSDGTYRAATRMLASLARNVDGTFTFTRKARERFTFDAGGLLIAQADLNGNVTTLTYTGGQLTTVTEPAGRTLTFTYGTNGLVSKVTGPAAQRVLYSYDPAGQLVTVNDANSGVTTFGYDGAGRHLLTSVKNPRNYTTTTNYDPTGRVIKQVDPLNRVTTFGYSPATSLGSLTITITDPKNVVTTQTYRDGLLATETRAQGTSQQATTSYT